MTAIFPGTERCYSWLSNLHLIVNTRWFIRSTDRWINAISHKLVALLHYNSSCASLARHRFLSISPQKNRFSSSKISVSQLFTLFYANIPREENVYTRPPFWILRGGKLVITLGLKFLGRLGFSLSPAQGKLRHKRYNCVAMKLAWQNFD